MKIKDVTILSVGILSFSLSLTYSLEKKQATVKASALLWEWSWVG